MIRVLVTFLALSMFCSASRAQEMPHFTIDTPTETRRRCRLTAFDLSGKLQAEHLDGKIDSPRLVELRQEEAALPPLLTHEFVGLTNGDRIPLDTTSPANLGENALKIWPATTMPSIGGKAVSLYSPHVAMIFWAVPDGVDRPEFFFAQLEKQPRKLDAIFLRNGDRIDGKVTKLSGKDGCVLTTERRTATVTWSKLAGIAWSTERAARPRTKGVYYRAILACGARLNLLDVRFDAKAKLFIAQTQFDQTLSIPESALLALDVRNGPAIDLADLTPTRYEFRPYLGASWPWIKNLSTANHPLRLAGSTFEDGIGTHASCTLEYKLDAKYARFDSLVGIDLISAAKGRAKVAIELDGKRIDLNAGKEISSRTPPIEVRMDVRGVRTLKLHVDFGSFGDVEAHVNWAKARLVKGGE